MLEKTEQTEGLADYTADRLQGRELLALADVQGLVGVEVFGGQNLSAGGAHLAVQLSCRAGRRDGRLPGVLLVPVFLPPAGTRLLRLAVCVGAQELLLLPGVREENQQLVEDAVEVVSQQVLAAAVVLGRRDHTLGNGEHGR